MLVQLEIKDFAIIDTLSVEFGPGLNVLTGETGAGKSILIDAIEFLVGGRASQTIIRQGAAKTLVQAIFDIHANRPLISHLTETGFTAEDALLTLSREFQQTGRSVCRINGTIIPINTVKETAEYILDLHGQHEHQTLLKPSTHLDWLDASEPSLWEERQKNSALVSKERALQKEMEAISSIGFEKEMDFLHFQLKELEEANLKIGEDEELKEKKERLEHLEQIWRNAAIIENLLTGEETPGVINYITEGARHLGEMALHESSVRSWKERLEEMAIELEELKRTISKIKEEAVLDPNEQEYILGRLDQIERLKRKYGSNIQEILTEKEAIRHKVNALANREEKAAAINQELKIILQQLEENCKLLTTLRHSQAQILTDLVNHELKSLSIGLDFHVELTQTDRITERGKDTAEFQVRPSSKKGDEGWLPLAKVASGGELSRLMLALKVVMAKVDQIPTIIYDEIDTGIGGEAAFAVANRLSRLSSTHQVLCVTHLHQIAAKADRHSSIVKESSNGTLAVKVIQLEKENRVREIARMIGGDQITPSALQHAKELLDNFSAGIAI